MIKENDIVSDFTMNSCSGESVRLADIGAKFIVLYFYPRDDTPGCTTEAKDFSMLKEEFAALDAVVYGVSKDDAQSHKKFKAKHNLTVDLLEDSAGIAEKFGVFVEKSMYGKKYFGIKRSTFLLDKRKKIIRIWGEVKVDNHAQEVLDYVKFLAL